jgi:hypothetical protein
MTTKTYEKISSPPYEFITFNKAKEMNKQGIAAFVIRGAGHDEIRDRWIQGINDQLVKEEKIFAKPVTEIYLLPVQPSCFTVGIGELATVQRVDIVMVYGQEQEPNMGRMAIWRLKWAGDIAWLEDYVVNDAVHYS